MRLVSGEQRKRFFRFLLLCAGGLALSTGCGDGTYRARLEQTEQYFAYVEHLNSHLAPQPWHSAGVEVRPPKQFLKLPATAISGETGPGKSATLPAALQKLEGLQAAWRAEVAVGNEKQPAFILVATNQHLQERGTVSLEETQQFQDRLAVAVHLLAGEIAPRKSSWSTLTVSQDDGFFSPKTFQPFLTSPFVLPESATPMRIHAYFLTQDMLQVAILFFLPEDVSAAEMLTERERIGLTLQTLKVSGAKLPPR